MKETITLLRGIPTLTLFWHSFWMFLVDIYIYILKFYAIWHSFSIFLAYTLTFYHAFYLASASLLTFYVTFYCMWHLALAIEVPQCPLRSGSRSWGPAVPTELWRSGLRPCSSAHWALALAVEAGQCPLAVDSVPHWDLALAVEGEVGGGRWRKRRRMRRWRKVGGTQISSNLDALTWQARNSRQRFFPAKV